MSHLIEVSPGIRIFAQDWGSGKPIVFIAGWPFDHRCYEYQFTKLPKEGFRCIGIDLRGYGQSDRPWKEYNYDVFAKDINTVLEKLNISDATLVGHSMGGAIALHYVALFGKKHVSKLALCGAAAPIWTQRPDFPYGFTKAQVNDLLQLCYNDRPQLLENFRKLFFYTENAISPAFGRWFENSGLNASAHATAECLIALQDTDLRSDLSKIEIPTAILHGRKDRVCPYALGEQLHKGIKGSKLITFEHSGHGLFYDEREKFNTTLIEFAS